MTEKRLISLDVFRGFTVLLMTLVNNPGSWTFVYPQLEHATWNGCTIADLVFPFFIFIVGVSIPFAIPDKDDNKDIFTKIVVRSLRIFCLGLALNFFTWINFFESDGFLNLVVKMIFSFGVFYALIGNFTLTTKKYVVFLILGLFLILALSGLEDFKTTRLMGVLQRIGIVYFFTAFLYLKTRKTIQIVVLIVLLLGYWILLTKIPVPGVGYANLDIGTNLASWLDSILLKNHMYIETKTWDPEGILSTIPSIASCIVGLLIGQLIHFKISKVVIVRNLFFIGLFLLVIGVFWDIFFPINKSIWTSSFVIFTSGIASIILAILYLLIEVLNVKSWTKPFLYWGINPILVFYFSGLIPRILAKIKFNDPVTVDKIINLQQYLYKYGIEIYFENPYFASLIGAIVYIIIWFFILAILYKNKIIIKV